MSSTPLANATSHKCSGHRLLSASRSQSSCHLRDQGQSALIRSTTERHDLKPVSVRCRHQPVKTFVKVPVTPGGTNERHLLERQEGMDGYDCNPCLKSARKPTVGSCAPAEVVRESGPKGPAYALNSLKSGFRPSNNNKNRAWLFWLEKKVEEDPWASSPMCAHMTSGPEGWPIP